MRRRSNAIHSDSSEEYMLLAEYSHDRPGYFYDEKFRHEVDSKLNKHRQTLVSEQNYQPLQLSGFDYSPLEVQRKEEEVEISAPSHRTEVVLTLIVNSVQQASTLLLSWFGGCPEVSVHSGQQLLDLFTHAHGNTLFKIWIIKYSSLDNALMQPYLTRSRQRIDLSEEVHDFQGELRGRLGRAMQGYVGSE